MKKNLLPNCLILVIAMAPVIYLALIWNSVTATVPLHFNMKMQPDRVGDKSELWIPVIILAVVSAGLYFLLRNLPYFDPKQKGSKVSSAFNKLGAGLTVFMSLLNFIIILSAVKGTFTPGLLFPLLGLLFAFMGNYMNNLKPNYFAGFRLPWTLSDDDNWRKTHHLAGKVWFAGGMLLALLGLLFSIKIIIPVFFSLMAIMVIIPSVYSYRLFKEKNLN